MFIPDAQLDFHEFGPVRDFEIDEILSRFLEEEHANGSDNLLVVVGKGNVVRPRVKKLLSESNLVDNFKKAGYYNGQSGAFEVTLSD